MGHEAGGGRVYPAGRGLAAAARHSRGGDQASQYSISQFVFIKFSMTLQFFQHLPLKLTFTRYHSLMFFDVIAKSNRGIRLEDGASVEAVKSPKEGEC